MARHDRVERTVAHPGRHAQPRPVGVVTANAALQYRHKASRPMPWMFAFIVAPLVFIAAPGGRYPPLRRRT